MQNLRTTSETANLVDTLDRVLDKGLVIAGDIRVSLANVELLTIRIRLLICSVEKAEQIGLNWWKFDPDLTAPLPAPSRRRGPSQMTPKKPRLARKRRIGRGSRSRAVV